MLPFTASASPLWNAAGTLGFALPKRSPFQTLLGAFVTNPISWGARTPAQGPRFLSYPGGVLLHTGLPNPGFRQVIRQAAPLWGRMTIPVIVHLLAERLDDLQRMVRQLEEVEGVTGIEIGVPPEADSAYLTEILDAAQGELPLLLRLSPDAVLPATLPEAVSLAPPRGTLPGLGSSFVSGRLLGPGMFPMALHAVRAWQDAGVPNIAGGGVYHPTQAEALLAAGAAAVQLDLCLWRESWPDEKWEKWLALHPNRHRPIIG